jgi:dipeptidyl aminopeptidase/acylaminoacyl peptidase
VSGKHEIFKQSTTLTIDEAYYSVPETITFPTANKQIAHGFYYPPTSKDYRGVIPDEDSQNEAPPLVVMMHGGPTGATHSALNLRTQFWTSRGFAVLDLNYRGSTGYGRKYRDKLIRQWGIVDVEDAVHGADYLVQRGKADKDRLAIRGGSAGGYTTLSALTFTDTFNAGASHFGVSDLEALAKDTHKFESRYLDSMIGVYPDEIEIYKARSPIHHVDQMASPCIFFQGLEDKVVPPNQAETMVEALTKKGVPVAYVPFENEQHGFRIAKNIKRCMDLELYFYSRVFRFNPADPIEPIAIINVDS